jgi:vacuolar protein sorting-associated protein 8
MSSSSVENDSGEEEKNNGDAPVMDEHPAEHEHGRSGSHPAEEHIVELLQEEREAPQTPEQIGSKTNRYKAIQQLDNRSEDGSVDALPPRPGSPPESVLSNPDDTPSVQVIKSPPVSDLYLTLLTYL